MASRNLWFAWTKPPSTHEVQETIPASPAVVSQLCGCPAQDSARCTDTLLNAQEDDSQEVNFHAVELYDFDLL